MKYLIEKKRKELKSSKLFPLEIIQLKEILLKNLIFQFFSISTYYFKPLLNI